MYDIDRPKFAFVSLLEDFIRETEHSLAYFFAVLVFLLTFLLALFGREAFYTGLVGVLCLLLIKLRDIIEGFKETRRCFLFYPPAGKQPQDLEKVLQSGEYPQAFCAAFEKAAAVVADKEFSRYGGQKEIFSVSEKPDLFSYLQTFWKITETLSLLFPDRPFQPETQSAIERMTDVAEKYLFRYLNKKYGVSKEEWLFFKKACFEPETDSFLLQTRMEAAGIDEKTARWAVGILQLLKKIRKKIRSEAAAGREEAPQTEKPLVQNQV